MRKQTLVIGCVMLVACSDHAVKEAVKDRLIDPGSAQFGPITISASGSEACAEVNAKNRMGGYSGRKQVLLRKVNGEWAWLNDVEESHDDCVQQMNDSKSQEAGEPSEPSRTMTPVDDGITFAPPTLEPGVVTIVATEPLWVQVRDGGKVLYMGELAAGQSYKVPREAAAPQLKAGKSEALKIFVGQEEIGPVGEPGRVVSGLSLRAGDLLR